MDTSSNWNGHDPTLSSTSQDEFQQFLDLGMSSMGDGLNFDFPDFNSHQNGQILQHDGGEAMDTTMDDDIAIMGQKNSIMQGHMPPMSSASGRSTIANTPIAHGLGSTDSLVELDAQIQYLQQQRQQQQQRQLEEQQRNYYAQNRMVPPTPNSIEMHGATSQFYPQQDAQQQAMYDRYQLRMKEQEMAFTPLVSPAVTPLEAHFNIPEYTVPGAYFSPLSSPALHAQNEHRSVYGTRHLDTSNGTSPVDMNIDSVPSSTTSGNGGRKSARKPTSKPRTPRAVRQSPIVKPQRRKTGSTVISPQTLSELVEPALQQDVQTQDSSRSNVSTEGSENDSISPEHLSDMAPPPLPRPGSASRSPYLISQNNNTRPHQLVPGGALSPATPASLMRLAKGNQSQPSPALSNAGDGDDHLMEGFSLPEAANPRPKLSRIETQSDGQTTPTLDSSTSRPSGFQPLPSPVFARPITAASASSPQIVSTPSSNPRKTPTMASTRPSVKKRSSTANTSVAVSPALRPRISPSIKPLIRGSGGTVSEDTASLLLASKSNYQNILEGTHLPGVNYPTELSTNLTSKRTSHKIAEQGRRNRINSALQEIAGLLPKGSGSGSGEADGDDVKGGGGAQSANSKASTVELAIEYIKQLKKEIEEANRRAEEAERKLVVKVEENGNAV